jgi:hypothetical protein
MGNWSAEDPAAIKRRSELAEAAHKRLEKSRKQWGSGK